MADTNIEFSKIVATPTVNAWSQAYSAGKVFAAISLESSKEATVGEDGLGAIGKELISTFESEFFTLEQKNLETIKQALSATISKISSEVLISMVLCFLEENILYLFAIGGGKAVLKRGDKVGTVLEGENDRSAVKPASGYVQEDDFIILETKSFVRIISPSTLASALDSTKPEEIAENLAPHVHDRSEGGAASVILKYKKAQIEPIVLPEDETKDQETENIDEISNAEPEDAQDGIIPVEDIDEEESSEDEISEVNNENIPEIDEDDLPQIETPAAPINEEPAKAPEEKIEDTEELSPFVTEDKFIGSRRQRFNFINTLSRLIPKNRRRFLPIAAGLIILIAIVGLLALTNKNNSQNNELFTKVLSEAKTKYTEGENLKDLNSSLSQQSFKDAQNILVKNEAKFKNNSSQNKQIQDLLSKVNSEIKNQGGSTVNVKTVDKSVSKILSAEIDNSSGLFFTENTNNVVYIDNKGVNQIDKGNGKNTEIFKKDWTTPGGIGTFGSNVYILDKSAGILKFVPSADTYSKSDYFTSDAPDLKNAVSMTIDGSIYILFKDGSIKKYTRAKTDTFSISGLDKPLSGQAKLFTSDNLDNLYALDIPNSRIVVLSKDGTYKTSYSAGIIKNAKDFDVKEADKKAYVLSDDKIYQIDLK